MKKRPTVAKKEKENPPTGPVFVFPGSEGWEVWSVENGGARCVGPAENPQKLKAPEGSVICLPSRSIFSVPLWIPVVEETSPKELTELALEKKNMLGADPEAAVWAMEPIRTERVAVAGQEEPGTRQLEATAVLAGPLEDDWILEQAGRHEIAGRVLPASGGGASAVLRRELGRWVMDFYVGGKWLHTQPLLSRELNAEAAAEIGTLLAQMDGEGILEELGVLVLRDEEAGAGAAEFLALLPCPVRIEPRVAPRLPTVPWDLQPPVLTERRLTGAGKAQKKKTIRAGVAIYLLVVCCAVAYFLVPIVRLKMTERQLATIAADAEKIREASMTWREAGALMNPKMNALELLWQVARPLIEKDPPQIEGVRLTSYDYNGKRLLLTGEGKDLEQTEKYFEWLKKEPMLAVYQWRHPQPRLLPNGNAQFQAEGIPPSTGVGEGEEGGTDANANAP